MKMSVRKVMLEKGDEIIIYVDGNVLCRMSAGEWSRMIAIPGSTSESK